VELVALPETDLELPVCHIFRGSQQVHIEPRLTIFIQQDGYQQELAIVQRHLQLAAVGSDLHVLDQVTVETANGFGDAAEILDGGE